MFTRILGFMCPACATVTPEYRPRFSRCCPSRCAARLLDRTRLRPPRARRAARRRTAGYARPSLQPARLEMSGPATLSIETLTVQLPEAADREHAVTGVTLQIRPGELLCLVGESGSGKSIIAQTAM